MHRRSLLLLAIVLLAPALALAQPPEPITYVAYLLNNPG